MTGQLEGGTRRLNHHLQSGRKKGKILLASLNLPLVIGTSGTQPDAQTTLTLAFPLWNKVASYEFILSEDAVNASNFWGNSYKNSVGSLTNEGDFNDTDVDTFGYVYYSNTLAQTKYGDGNPLYYGEDYYGTESTGRKSLSDVQETLNKQLLTYNGSVPIITWKGTEGVTGEGGYTMNAATFELTVNRNVETQLLTALKTGDYSNAVYLWFGLMIPLTFTVPLSDQQVGGSPIGGVLNIYG